MPSEVERVVCPHCMAIVPRIAIYCPQCRGLIQAGPAASVAGPSVAQSGPLENPANLNPPVFQNRAAIPPAADLRASGSSAGRSIGIVIAMVGIVLFLLIVVASNVHRTEFPVATPAPAMTARPAPYRIAPVSPNINAAPEAPVSSELVSIPINGGWVDTGVDVAAGQSISLLSAGTDTGLPYGSKLPDEILGRIGATATFTIDATLRFQAAASGRLFLRIADRAARSGTWNMLLVRQNSLVSAPAYPPRTPENRQPGQYDYRK